MEIFHETKKKKNCCTISGSSFPFHRQSPLINQMRKLNKTSFDETPAKDKTQHKYEETN